MAGDRHFCSLSCFYSTGTITELTGHSDGLSGKLKYCLMTHPKGTSEGRAGMDPERSEGERGLKRETKNPRRGFFGGSWRMGHRAATSMMQTVTDFPHEIRHTKYLVYSEVQCKAGIKR
jgi:hypothetical protein